jgi:hypothetical protein
LRYISSQSKSNATIIIKNGIEILMNFFKQKTENLVDLVIAILCVPAAYLLYFFRRYGSRKLPLSTIMLKKIGIFPIINHYYEPLFDMSGLPQALDQVRDLPGLDLRVEAQLELLTHLKYTSEFTAFINASNDASNEIGFKIDNQSFEHGDADFLFQIIRHKKPNKVLEIGSGWSTKVAKHALTLNAGETGRVSDHICIEPYEQPWLEKLGNIQLRRTKVEDSQINWSVALSSGDLLFIDSSHMIRPQGDVLYEYLYILPLLSSGVLVHVHDIFTPRDYPRDWMTKDVKFWNEQYLLETLLSNSQRYEIISALNMLKNDHFESLKKVCPTLEKIHEPGSIYFRVK